MGKGKDKKRQHPDRFQSWTGAASDKSDTQHYIDRGIALEAEVG
jgi:hypothetical protein